MSGFTSITRFPRMESPSRWERPAIALGAGWHDEIVALLKTKVIPAKRDRFVGKGDKKFPVPAKGCAPGIAPYLLHPGGKRGEADMRARSEWTHLLLDLDAAPLTVTELRDVVERAIGHLRHATWTTWSCKDGYASARVLLPLSRTVNEEEIIALFWGARRMVLDAGLPSDSAKPDEPCVDSRCLDGRLFYLPSMPASPTPEDKWGGTIPRGHVSADSVPVLDVDSALVAGRSARSADEGAHIARWPHVPVPGKRKAKVRVAGSSTGPRSASDAPEVHIVDFGKLAMFGTGLTMKAWADKNLPTPNTEVGIGGWVFDPNAKWTPGDSALNYNTANLHRDEHGRLWAKDWVEGDVYVHEALRPTIEEQDAAEDILKGCAPTLETTAARLLRDGKFGDVVRLVVPVENPSDEALHILQEAMRGLDGEEVETERDESLSVYEERLAKKRDEAKALDPVAVEGAKRAMSLAKEFVGAVRAKLRAEGLPLPDPEKPCGVHLGLHHAGDGRLATMRGPCGSDQCPTCAPVVVARRMAAVLACPITGEDGTVTGSPMGERPIWAFDLDEARLETFTRKWREAYLRLPLRSSKVMEGPKEEVGDKDEAPISARDAGHAYVAFHLANQKVVVLSTFDVPVIRRRGGAAPLVGDAIDDLDAIRARVVKLGTASYRYVEGTVVEGLEDTTGGVAGSIRGSYGLSLNPATVARTASASEWVGLGPVKAGTVKAALDARSIANKAEEREEDGAKVVEKVASVGYVSPEVAKEVAAEASTRRPRPVVSADFAPVEEIDLDALIAEMA